MPRTRRSAIALIGSWVAAAGVRPAEANGLSPSHAEPDAHRSPKAPAAASARDCRPSHIAISLKVTDYPEKAGSYRWDAEAAIADCTRQKTTKASTWGFREIGILGWLRGEDSASGYAIEFKNGPSPCSTWSIAVNDPSGTEVISVSFSFEGTPPTWPPVSAA